MDSVAILRQELYTLAAVTVFFLTIIFTLIGYFIRKQDKEREAADKRLTDVEKENKSIVNNYTARFQLINQRIDDTRLQITTDIRDMKEELLEAIRDLSVNQATNYMTKQDCEALHAHKLKGNT